MRTVTRGFAQGLIVSLLVAGGIAACVDATRSTSTEPALSEGARVSLAGGSSISFQGLDGKVLSTAAHEWAVDAVVTNGIAEAKVAGSRSVDVGMPALAISDDHPLARGRPSQHQHISAKDRNGNLQDFVVITGEQGGPAKTIVHLANHKIDQSYSYEWKKIQGGWMAMSFAVTLFKDGQPFATIRSVNRQLRAPGADGTAALLANGRIAYSEEDNCIFKADVPCDGSPVLGDTGGLVPDASDCPQCTPDLQNYLAAATALASATQIAIDTGTIIFPAVYIGLAAAAIYVAILLSRYNTCVAQCRGLADSGGGDALFTPSSRLLSPYRSMYLRPA